MPERVAIRMWFGVVRIDRYAADRTVAGDGSRTGGTGADQRPAVPAVRAAVETEAGLAVAARVGLTGADVNRVPARIRRVDGDRPDCARRDVAGDERPLRLVGERVLRPPDAAACGRDVQRALLRVALRVDSESRDAAGPLCAALVGLRSKPVDVQRRRAERLPLERMLRATLGDLRAGGDRRLPLAERDLGARVCPGREVLRRRAVRIDGRPLGDLRFALTLANAADRRGVLGREPGLRRRARARASPERHSERHADAHEHECKHKLAPVIRHLDPLVERIEVPTSQNLYGMSRPYWPGPRAGASRAPPLCRSRGGGAEAGRLGSAASRRPQRRERCRCLGPVPIVGRTTGRA